VDNHGHQHAGSARPPPTLTSVINAIQSVTQKIAGAIVFTTVDWAPQIIVTVDSSLNPPSVVNRGKTAIYFYVEDPIVRTQLQCSC
jgi:hypothetical protein